MHAAVPTAEASSYAVELERSSDDLLFEFVPLCYSSRLSEKSRAVGPRTQDDALLVCTVLFRTVAVLSRSQFLRVRGPAWVWGCGDSPHGGRKRPPSAHASCPCRGRGEHRRRHLCCTHWQQSCFRLLCARDSYNKKNALPRARRSRRVHRPRESRSMAYGAVLKQLAHPLVGDKPRKRGI